MAFLRINGWTIPVREFAESPTEIGYRARAFDGTQHLGRRAIKRSWKGNTSRRLPSIGSSIRGAILGLGEAWSFDTGLWSHGGAGATGTTSGNIRPGTAADGYPVLDAAKVKESKFGAGSLAVEPLRTNILAADSRDAEAAPTGYTAVGGAAIAGSTGRKFQGARSLQITAVGAGNEGATVTTAVAASTTYTASVYVSAPVAMAINLILIPDVGAPVASQVDFATVPVGTWVRLSTTITTAVGAASLVMRLETNDPDAGVFFADAWQLEIGAWASSWVDGARTTGNDLAYSAGLVTGSRDLTIAAWVKSPTVGLGANAYLARLSSSAGSISLLRQSGVNNLLLALSVGGASDSIQIPAPAWDGGWHHIVATLESRGDAGTRASRIYKDGVLIASDTPTVWPDVSTMTNLYVGNGAGNEWYGLIDDLVIAPYAWCAAQVAAAYAFGAAMSPLPRIYVDGDFESLPDATLLALGAVSSVSQHEGAAGAAFYHTLREIEFDLSEV